MSIEILGATEGRGSSACRGVAVRNALRGSCGGSRSRHWRHVKGSGRRGGGIVLMSRAIVVLRGARW